MKTILFTAAAGLAAVVEAREPHKRGTVQLSARQAPANNTYDYIVVGGGECTSSDMHTQVS